MHGHRDWSTASSLWNKFILNMISGDVVDRDWFHNNRGCRILPREIRTPTVSKRCWMAWISGHFQKLIAIYMTVLSSHINARQARLSIRGNKALFAPYVFYMKPSHVYIVCILVGLTRVTWRNGPLGWKWTHIILKKGATYPRTTLTVYILWNIMLISPKFY